LSLFGFPFGELSGFGVLSIFMIHPSCLRFSFTSVLLHHHFKGTLSHSTATSLTTPQRACAQSLLYSFCYCPRPRCLIDSIVGRCILNDSQLVYVAATLLSPYSLVIAYRFSRNPNIQRCIHTRFPH
jgi:hypothetical protein